MKSVLTCLCTLTLAALLASCGGSDYTPPATTTTPTTTTTTTTTTVTGSVVKGNVSGSTVTVKNAGTGAVLGTATTDASGAYTLTISYNGDVIVEASGGTYTDEATNQPVTLSTPLRSVLAASGASVTAMVTPLTTMAYVNAFPTGAAVTSAAFNTQAANVAKLFKLNGSLLTTMPVVSGTPNDYGRALAGLSKYLQMNNVTLPTVTDAAFTSAQWTQFVTAYNGAYAAVYPNLGFSLDGSAFNVTLTGTGVGGGSGSCGIGVSGSLTSQGVTVPLSLNYCITGIATGSCTSGNATLAQTLSGQSGLIGAANLAYTYSATCAPGAFTIKLN